MNQIPLRPRTFHDMEALQLCLVDRLLLPISSLRSGQRPTPEGLPDLEVPQEGRDIDNEQWERQTTSITYILYKGPGHLAR